MRKKLKELKERAILFGVYVLLIGFPIICVVLSIAIAYWVSTSDLPDWFKFWILSSK